MSLVDFTVVLKMVIHLFGRRMDMNGKYLSLSFGEWGVDCSGDT